MRYKIRCVIDKIRERVFEEFKYELLDRDVFNVEARFLAESILEEEFGWMRSKLIKVQFDIDDDNKLVILFYDNRYNKKLNSIEEIEEILGG